jgi:hypothetical protein
VASVFTFGVAAALESVALGRWQKKTDHDEPAAPPDAAEPSR